MRAWRIESKSILSCIKKCKEETEAKKQREGRERETGTKRMHRKRNKGKKKRHEKKT